MSLTLETLRLRVCGAIGLDNTTGSEEQGLVDGWLNEGIEKFVARTKCKLLTAVATLTAGEDDYTVTSSILAVKRVRISDNDNWLELDPMTLEEINERRYRAASGDRPTGYVLVGYDLLIFDVAPTSDVELELLYVPRPESMVDAADTPQYVPSEHHDLIETYAKWKAADWDDDTSSQVGQLYKKEWFEGLAGATANMNRRRGRLAPFGLKRGSVFPTRNGVDYR